MTRESVSQFLIGQKDKTKEEVLANFASYAITIGEKVEKLGKLISDLRSYPEWTWGE
jgi:hypothetical protein